MVRVLDGLAAETTTRVGFRVDPVTGAKVVEAYGDLPVGVVVPFDELEGGSHLDTIFFAFLKRT
jgi:hypothetical protein